MWLMAKVDGGLRRPKSLWQKKTTYTGTGSGIADPTFLKSAYLPGSEGGGRPPTSEGRPAVEVRYLAREADDGVHI